MKYPFRRNAEDYRFYTKQELSDQEFVKDKIKKINQKIKTQKEQLERLKHAKCILKGVIKKDDFIMKHIVDNAQDEENEKFKERIKESMKTKEQLKELRKYRKCYL